MSGPIALHGGGEFLPGDEPFLAAILDLAAQRVRADRPIRVAIVPTAAARGRPDLAAANGVGAFERVAAAAGLDIRVAAVAVVDEASAADPALAARLAEADLIHLPGGDPDLIPTILGGSRAWTAIGTAYGSGAVLAGASAGAMALANWTWTPRGGIVGLEVVPGLVVVPHADAAAWSSAIERFGRDVPPGLGALGLEERTGVISDDPDDRAGRGGIEWRVVGPGEARWLPAQNGETIVRRSGESLRTAIPSRDGPSPSG